VWRKRRLTVQIIGFCGCPTKEEEIIVLFVVGEVVIDGWKRVVGCIGVKVLNRRQGESS
jgi:hypothetical protein